MLALVKHQARVAVRRGLALSFAIALALVGIGFLTHGAWLYLETEFSAEIASYVVGGAYVFVGLAIFTALRRPHKPAIPPAQSKSQNVALVEAFLVGMDAGKSRGRGRG